MRTAILIGGAALVCGLAIAAPFVGSEYLTSFFFTMFLFAGMAYGWNLISGYTAYLSFGQISFFGIGAYAVAILVSNRSWPWPFAVLAGAALAAAIAVPIGWAMLRLRGPYFALGMLGFVQVLEMVASAWSSVTGGGEGVYLAPATSLRPLYYAAAAMVIVGIALTSTIDRSAFGLRLRSIGEDETAAEAVGVYPTRAKLAAFVLASLFPAVAGGLYAYRLSYVDPSSAFPEAYEVQVILMVVFGGAATVWGPLAGASLLTAVGELLWARFAELHLLLFGLIIVVVLRYMPEGLIPLLRQRSARKAAAPLAPALRKDAA
jgi:branched-chain amino acid transport system permease protein